MTLLADRPVSHSAAGEKQLRLQINRSVTRALLDEDYARALLTDPTVALEEIGCQPQQYRSLRNIRACDVPDFARQAYSLFWIAKPELTEEEVQPSLVAAAAL